MNSQNYISTDHRIDLGLVDAFWSTLRDAADRWPEMHSFVFCVASAQYRTSPGRDVRLPSLTLRVDRRVDGRVSGGTRTNVRVASGVEAMDRPIKQHGCELSTLLIDHTQALKPAGNLGCKTPVDRHVFTIWDRSVTQSPNQIWSTPFESLSRMSAQQLYTVAAFSCPGPEIKSSRPPTNLARTKKPMCRKLARPRQSNQHPCN
jgi:hypothetical protein